MLLILVLRILTLPISRLRIFLLRARRWGRLVLRRPVRLREGSGKQPEHCDHAARDVSPPQHFSSLFQNSFARPR